MGRKGVSEKGGEVQPRGHSCGPTCVEIRELEPVVTLVHFVH